MSTTTPDTTPDNAFGTTFARKVGIITGAGSGLGAASARHLAKRGATLLLADRNHDTVARVAQEINEEIEAGSDTAGGRATAIAADVTLPEDTERLVAAAVATYGRLDFAFNNAGITPALVDVHQIDPADWRSVIEVNLTGIFNSMRAELAHFVDNGAGTILNMASTAGVMAHAGRSAYSASKHGIIGLTRSAAVEYAQRGIRINAIAPGPIDGPSAQNLPAEVRAMIAAKTAMNRTGTLDEVAAVAGFLLSDQASFVTGSVYEVNGGQTQL